MNAQTKTAAKQQQTQAPHEPENKGALTLRDPRLEYPPDAYECFNVDKTMWLALVESIFPLARTTQAVFMALAWCKARRLDVMKKPCHVVPMWNSALNREVETVWPSIAEVRITAFRTGCYAGADETVFGPTVEVLYEDQERPKRNAEEQQGKKPALKSISQRLAHPEWAQITVYRQLGSGVVAKFVGPKTYFREWYSGRKGLKVPNERWCRAPWQMLEKCAEAAALRKAFPEELGDHFTAEEMEGKVIDHEDTEGPEVEPPPRPRRADFKGAAGPGPVTDVPDEASPESEGDDGEPAGDQRDEPPAGEGEPQDEPKSKAAAEAEKREPVFWERSSLAVAMPKDGKGHDDFKLWAEWMGDATRDAPTGELLGRLERENEATFKQLLLKMPDAGYKLRGDFKAAGERLAAQEG